MGDYHLPGAVHVRKHDGGFLFLQHTQLWVEFRNMSMFWAMWIACLLLFGGCVAVARPIHLWTAGFWACPHEISRENAKCEPFFCYFLFLVFYGGFVCIILGQALCKDINFGILWAFHVCIADSRAWCTHIISLSINQPLFDHVWHFVDVFPNFKKRKDHLQGHSMQFI